MSLLRTAPTGIIAAANQETGSFDPDSITGLELWLDASETSSIHGTPVDSWDDLSGNARHVTAATTKRPSSGTRTLNSLNVIDFDGTNDSMKTSAFGTVANPWTICVVAASDDGADGTWQHIVGSVTTAGYGVGKRVSNFWFVGGGNELYSSVAVTTAAKCVIGMTKNPSTSAVIRVGSTETGGGNPGTGSLTGGICIGASTDTTQFWDGIIAEVLVYSIELDATNRALVASYLQTKWGV